jgi:glutamate carboxypeptidase
VRERAEVSARLLSHRPTWRPGPAGEALLQQIKDIAAEIGEDLDGRPADGAADTNTAGSLGYPTVDGLAPAGGGAHARTEWVSAASIAGRTALLAALLTGADGASRG